MAMKRRGVVRKTKTVIAITDTTKTFNAPLYYEKDGLMERIDGTPEPEETDNEQCERLAREMGSCY